MMRVVQARISQKENDTVSECAELKKNTGHLENHVIFQFFLNATLLILRILSSPKIKPCEGTTMFPK